MSCPTVGRNPIYWVINSSLSFPKMTCKTWPPKLPALMLIYHPSIFSTAGIKKLLQTVDCKKANGSDGIPCYILKEAAAELAPFLQFLFTQSLHTGSVPQAWLKETVVPIHKKGSRSQVVNYRPISLTSVPCKIIMEHITVYLPWNDVRPWFKSSAS